MLAKLFNKHPQIVQQSACYETCSEVVMSAFIKAIVKHDLSGLIKSGQPDPTALLSAWENVFNEYLRLSGDSHITATLSLLKSISMLTNKLSMIEMIVNQVSAKHSKGLTDQLREMGFRFQYENGPELQRELELTIIQSKQLLLELEEDKAELAELRSNEGTAATELDYELQLSSLEEFKHVAINADTYTVARYIADIKRLKERNAPKP